MKSFTSVGIEQYGNKIRYYTLKLEGDVTQYIGKRIVIDGKVRKVLHAEEWTTIKGEQTGRYRFWVWK